MDTRIGFYEEVKISINCKDKNKKYADKKGGVMGISEENGVIYGYAIKLYDEKYILSFDKNEVVATGNKRTQDDFY